MKKILFLACIACMPLFVQAQAPESITLTVSGDQYQQLEKHFSEKAKEQKQNSDWARFSRYEAMNADQQEPVKVVFMGNSITEGWVKTHPDFFTENKFTGRGISGQTTSEMLVRFQSDVINLKPQMVVIMAGTNDIARNNGIISHEHILQNIQSMCELAKFHKIKPVLCSVLPAYKFRWNMELSPAPEIKKLNDMIKAYAEANKIPYVDYYSAMVDSRGGLAEDIARDGVHPNLKGYEMMEPIVLKVVRKYVKK